ncbi:MAG: PQQ-binding-like beta-propeller repeat protein [Pseudonocardiaceae bacterium]
MTTETEPPSPSPDAPDLAVPESPYVGLVPFNEEDAAYFFGREREIDLIVANLTATRLTLLYAPSGVGKSSVLRAGVLPALHHIDDDSYADLGVPGAAVAYVSTWRDAPLETIAAAVSAAVSRVTGAGPVEDSGETGANAPTLSVPWLREVLRQSRVSTVYLILDQFEEYFLYHPMDRGEEGLTAELGSILSARDLPVHVLLSIREDALAGLDRFKGGVPHLFDNYLRLTHLSRDAAQAAIEGPLDRYNDVVPPDRTMSIEPGLIGTLLDQVRTGHVQVAAEGTSPNGLASAAPASDDRGDIETPYLQLVLTRLWDAERATGSSSLRRSTLDDLGGAQTIVQTHLDNVMAGLSPAQVDVAAAVFHHMITTSGTKIALPAEDLAEWSGLPVSAVRDLLETLCSGPQRILRPVPPAVGVAGPPRYEIFHDVMGSAVLDWRRRYVARRQEAEAKRQQDEASRQLIAEREEARTAARTARRQLRQTLLAVGLAVMLLAIGVFAYQSHRNAQLQTYLAQAATALGDNPVQSLKRAVDAYQVKANEQARSAVLTAASSPRSQVVAGPDPAIIGMKSTPDSRYVVAYDAHGSIRIIGDNGAVEREAKADGLRGTVTPAPRTAAVNPDASRVALGTDQGTVAVIDTATGRHIDIDSGEGSPRVVTWIGSAANGLVLIVSRSGVTTTHSPETGEQIARFPGVVHDALPLADEQQHIVTSGQDDKLRVWDARTGSMIAESSTLNPAATGLRRYAQSVVGLSAPAGAKPSIIVWNWQAGPDPIRYPINGFNELQQVVIDEQAQTIIISQDKEVRTYSLVDGLLLRSLPQQADFVKNVATSPDGPWIATAGADGRVLVWFPGHRRSPTAPTYELLAHLGAVTQLNYLREGKVVMSLGVDGTVRRWELPQVPRFAQHDSWVSHIDLSRDGSWLVTASQDGNAFIVDPHNLSKPPVDTVSAGTPLRVVLFDPTEPHRILTLARSSSVPELWHWGDDGKSERLQKYAPPPLPTFGYLVSLAISPDGKTVASGDDRGTIHLWDATTGALRTDREFPGTGQPADSVAFDPTGQLLAATDNSGVRLWRLDTAAPPTLLRHPYATSVVFDPSGKQLASTAGDGTVNIWTRDGHLDQELVAHGHLSSSPSFSRDGGLLAVGTAGGLVEVWDVHSGVTVMLDRHHSGSVNNVVFLSGDRSRLISASDDATVAQFSCPACTDPDRVIREAVEWAGTNPESPNSG